MSWTAPRTWVAGEKPTAATMNLHIRDNLLALGTWTSFTPTWTNVTLGTTGLINTARYAEAGKVVTVKFMLKLGTGGSFTGTPGLAFPLTNTSPALEALGTAIADDTSIGSSGRRALTAYVNGVNAQFLYNGDDAGTKLVNTGVPFTWAVGDTLAGTFTYEAA